MFTALMCVLAYLFFYLPLSPVAISAQTFGVMLAGLVLEPNPAALSQGLYLLLGALGLPVFAGGASGIGILIGPRGGYLWGFIVGAYVTATVIQKAKEDRKTNHLADAGLCIIYRRSSNSLCHRCPAVGNSRGASFPDGLRTRRTPVHSRGSYQGHYSKPHRKKAEERASLKAKAMSNRKASHRPNLSC